MDQTENPRIRPIRDLLNENFFVPRYQRGYRWGKQEITELLDDILQYYLLTQDRDNKVSKFYCLQPIVVKRREWKNNNDGETVNGWELIDGQQRLTTILILLHYLEDVRQLIGLDTNVYSISFETRENCNQFFKDKVFKSKVDESNVDFYHISMAYKHIETWFKEHNNKLEVLNTLLKSDYNVSIIWYEVAQKHALDNSQAVTEEDNTIDLFTRLNEGKIPLTDAELIKALLLQADLYPQSELKFISQRLFEIASEWDEMEASLQDERMWLFINEIDYNPSSRIELIFKLLADKWNGTTGNKLVEYDIKNGKPKHFEYLVFDKYLAHYRRDYKTDIDPNNETLAPVNKVWKEIKDLYSILLEWFENHSLFHYIGYLLAIDPSYRDKLIKEAFNPSFNKSDFITYLKKEIANSIRIRKQKENSEDLKELRELEYREDDNEIRKILLLFNVETLVHHRKENARFPFHLFKKEKITSIEHIHPQNPESINVDEERCMIWLTSHIRTLEVLQLTKDEFKERITVLINDMKELIDNYNKDVFTVLHYNTLELYTEIVDFKESELHTLYNLALVDKDTNSRLNNSFFDIKRRIIKENEHDRYIPICTERAFSKYYSESSREMIFWSDSDRKSYFQAIENVYNSFISQLHS